MLYINFFICKIKILIVPIHKVIAKNKWVNNTCKILLIGHGTKCYACVLSLRLLQTQQNFIQKDSKQNVELLDFVMRYMKGQSQYWKAVLPKPHHHKITAVFSMAQGQGVSTTHKFYVNAASWGYASQQPLPDMMEKKEPWHNPAQHFRHQTPFVSFFVSSNSFNYHIQLYFLTLWNQFSCHLPVINFNWINLQPYYEIVAGAGMVVQKHLGEHLRTPLVSAGESEFYLYYL